MLDSEQQIETVEAEQEAVAEADTPEVQADEAAPEVVIGIAGEEADADPDDVADEELGPAGRAALKAARESAREYAREAREVKARLAEIEAASRPAEDVLGPEPQPEDSGWDNSKHNAAVIAWNDKRRAIEAKKAEADKARKASEEAYQVKLEAYHANRGKVGVDDEAQARVVAALSPQQQTALMDAVADPAKMVAALARSPKALAELSAIKEIHKFAYKLAQVEGKITVTTKAPPPVESKLRGGGSVADAVSTVPLDKLRERAEASGDYSSYFAEKRRRAESGTKS